MQLLKQIRNIKQRQFKQIRYCLSQYKFQEDPEINSIFKKTDYLEDRHIGIKDEEIQSMIKETEHSSLDQLMDKLVPKGVFDKDSLNFEGKQIPHPLTESEMLEHMKELGSQNKKYKSYIGEGFYDTIVPPVIQRNLLENPGWYTAYTPYQAEISQGRLENLMNFQTMITELTGMDVANASLLDEASAAGESLLFSNNVFNGKRKKFFVSKNTFPVTIEVVKTRAAQLGIEVIVDDEYTYDFDSNGKEICGVLLQNPNNEGQLKDYTELFSNIKQHKCVPIVAIDLLSLTLSKTPKEMGAELVIGNSQRFGVPLGYGGPHAAFMACIDKNKRKLPGRIIGISKDKYGNIGYRMALQTREQHIKREKSTSNICTAQALLANMAASYAIYHGKQGLKQISTRINNLAGLLAYLLSLSGYSVENFNKGDLNNLQFFDTIRLIGIDSRNIEQYLQQNEVNVRIVDQYSLQISLDETTTLNDIYKLVTLFQQFNNSNILQEIEFKDVAKEFQCEIDPTLQRQSDFFTQEVFKAYQTESKMMRYLAYLEKKDIGLNKSMIALGSCTMKLNAASQLIPISWPEFNGIHPYVPSSQAEGYKQMIQNITEYLQIITKFDGISLQPNSGATGEYSGLLAIKEYQKSIGQSQRNVCIIPISAHGTNPASAMLAGLKIVSINIDTDGSVDLKDLEEKCKQHADNLSVFMITYPSTYGVYEDTITKACDLVHKYGGQVYMDGANMNAQVGYTSPGFIGADVCHLNLHKTFSIPHGGGGPGLGPIGVKKHLIPFLPGHIYSPDYSTGNNNITVAQSPFSSASIIPITYSYIRQLGYNGMKNSTRIAILNANYMMNKLKDHYNIVYTKDNLCAHEFIIDIRPFKKYNIVAKDVAKRLSDYCFHSPTVSFPIIDTLMIEPTESEDKEELDRFIDAMIQIRKEISLIEEGVYTTDDNPLINAPHTEQEVILEEWNHCYSKQVAAFPLPWVQQRGKFWCPVGRIDEALGDRQFIGKSQDKKQF